ncbi:MAG: peptidoglycan-associated lipoprotein Pal [Deltaproteobacteria bacterium]|nr:peptidoglycan-associated lipoprotein Pal [Deltaproteobacteria bacterium]
MKEKQLWEQLLAQAAEFKNKDINFAFDRYDLNADARQKLERLADWLLAHSEFEVTIEGHCDERGTTEYNLALGERRAEAAKAYIVNLGVDVNRISTISYGEELPLDPRSNEEAWAKNRRDHFLVYPSKK